MSKSKFFLAIALTLTFASAAFAGGPLLVDPQTKSAYHYDTSTPVPVYYDLGNLGVVQDYSTYPPTPVTFDNTVGKNLVTKGFGDWSGIKTASFRANVAGDFSQLGLPDIDATNITTSQAAKKFTFCECFVSGHDFSRAVIHLKLSRALAPVVGFRGRTTTFSAASSAVRTGPLNSCRSQRLRPARVRLFKRRFERARLQPCRKDGENTPGL